MAVLDAVIMSPAHCCCLHGPSPMHPLSSRCALQMDDPLDAIAVHAWNGGVGVLAPGFIASQGLIAAAYGFESTDGVCVENSNDPNHCPFLQHGCFLGGDGHLLGAQIIYFLWIVGAWHALLRAEC